MSASNPRKKTSETDASVELFAGKYRLIRLLGKGAMGEVWLAEEEGPRNFRRRVAVKRLVAKPEIGEYAKDSFFAEAQVIARLDHPNVVRLIELGTVDGAAYLVLDYVDGPAMDRVLKRMGAFSPRAVAYIGREVARALEAVHAIADDDGRSYTVVHRDVSPSNILIARDGRVRLTDFGVARISGFGDQQTEVGVFKGKLAYMPPEQARGELFDGRADVFSLGLTLLEAALGRRVRRAETQSQLIMSVASAPVARARELLPELPAALADALDSATEFDADKRMADAGCLATALDRALGEMGEGAEQEARAELKERIEAFVHLAGPLSGPGSRQPPPLQGAASVAEGGLEAGRVMSPANRGSSPPSSRGARSPYGSVSTMLPPSRGSSPPSSRGALPPYERGRASPPSSKGTLPPPSRGTLPPSSKGTLPPPGKGTLPPPELTRTMPSPGLGSVPPPPARTARPSAPTSFAPAVQFLEFDDAEDTIPSAVGRLPTAAMTPEEELRRLQASSGAPRKGGAARAGGAGGPSAEQRRRRRIFFAGLGLLGGLALLRVVIAVRSSAGEVGPARATSSSAAAPPGLASAAAPPGLASAAAPPGLASAAPPPEPTPTGVPASRSSEPPGPRGTSGTPRPAPSASSRPQGEAASVDETKPGTLQVVVLPWADVSVDGRGMGTTPIPAISLAPGAHPVVLRNPELGASRRMTVVVKPGAPTLLRVDLRRAP